MTRDFLAGLADRLRRLVEQFADLRRRVREAVAVEAGRAVGDAVRDLLAGPAGRHEPDPPDEAWYGDNVMAAEKWGRHHIEAKPANPNFGWPSAVAAGAAAARRSAARTGGTRASAALGVLAAAGAAFDSPAIQAAAATAAALVELLLMTRAA